MIYVTSFGYRNGVPPDSDLVFDVRFLPNPNYIPRFKNLTGRNPDVARYIRSFPQTVEFINRISDLLVYLLPHYIREGKSYLTISFGCTGGQHRSVMMADEIRKNLAAAGYTAKVNHRDIVKAPLELQLPHCSFLSPSYKPLRLLNWIDTNFSVNGVLTL